QAVPHPVVTLMPAGLSRVSPSTPLHSTGMIRGKSGEVRAVARAACALPLCTPTAEKTKGIKGYCFAAGRHPGLTSARRGFDIDARTAATGETTGALQRRQATSTGKQV